MTTAPSDCSGRDAGNQGPRLYVRAILFSVLVSGCVAPHPVPQTVSRTGADANERLLMTAGTFTSSHISQAGITPPAVHAFRALFLAPDARDRFMRIAQRATVEGQLFGLCGLYFLDPSAFERESRRVREAGSRVRTMFDCELEVVTTTALLTPDPAARRLPNEWDASLWAKVDEGIRLDIPSGGRCYELRSE